MATNEPTKSNIELTVKFHATADTPRISAWEIAARVRDFLAADMDLAGTTVEVGGAFLNYREAWEAEREQYPNQGFAEGVSDTLNANRLDPLVEAANEALALDESNLWGNPAKDQSN